MLMKTDVCCQTAKDRDLDCDAGDVLSGERADIIPGQTRQHNTRHLAPREFPVVKVNKENGNINEMLQDQT